MTDKHNADEAFEANMRNSGWPESKREFEKYELLALWRAACAYQQAADAEIVEDVRHCIDVDLTGTTADDENGWDEACIEIKRRITGEKA